MTEIRNISREFIYRIERSLLVSNYLKKEKKKKKESVISIGIRGLDR